MLMRERGLIKCVWGEGEGVEPLSDIGEQGNNGPQQIHIFDNPHCSLLSTGEAKLGFGSGRDSCSQSVFVQGVDLSSHSVSLFIFYFFPPS